MQTRRDYSLSAIQVYRHSSILHSVLSTFLPLTTTQFHSNKVAIEYPFVYFVENSVLKVFNLNTSKVTVSHPLSLPSNSAVHCCYASHSFVVLVLKMDSGYVLNVYQALQTSFSFHSTIQLPGNEYDSCSIQIQETYQGFEVNLITTSKCVTVYTISLSTSKYELV